jgi:hypothetical protein
MGVTGVLPVAFTRLAEMLRPKRKNMIFVSSLKSNCVMYFPQRRKARKGAVD